MPKWPVRLHPPERESMKWAIWRGSEEERNNMLWAPDNSRGQEDPFWGLRQTMMVIGHTIDLGCHWVMIRDPTQRDRDVIVIRVRLCGTLGTRSHLAHVRISLASTCAASRCRHAWHCGGVRGVGHIRDLLLPDLQFIPYRPESDEHPGNAT